MRWHDIDLEHGVVTVVRRLDRTGTSAETKTRAHDEFSTCPTAWWQRFRPMPSSIRETKDVYGHLVAEDSRRAAEAMNRVLYGQ